MYCNACIRNIIHYHVSHFTDIETTIRKKIELDVAFAAVKAKNTICTLYISHIALSNEKYDIYYELTS